MKCTQLASIYLDHVDLIPRDFFGKDVFALDQNMTSLITNEKCFVMKECSLASYNALRGSRMVET